MKVGSPRLLVIDDREDEGIKISKALWAAGLAARFFQYDERALMRAARRKLSGVRVIFMDINLLGGPMGNEQTSFAAVQQSILSLLHDDNGPYLLVTWSSHDDYAARLFDHLGQRLPEHLKPAATARLDKADFQGRRGARLKGAVEERLAGADFFALLWAWESTVFESTAYVASLVTKLALEVGVDRKAAVGTVLKALALADAGKQLSAKNAVRSYSSVLNHILMDCTEARRPHKADPAVVAKLIDLPDGPKRALWKRRTNRMINIDEVAHPDAHAPGDVFPYPAHGARSRKPLPNIEHAGFILENFISADFAKGKADAVAQKAALAANWKLILVETTPPCDHAQAKPGWHRYAVGVEIPEADLGKGNAVKQAHNLMTLPPIQLSGDAHAIVIVLNSRLTVSLTPKDTRRVGDRKYRLRTQLLGDVIGWISRQQSRVGYLSLP